MCVFWVGVGSSILRILLRLPRWQHCGVTSYENPGSHVFITGRLLSWSQFSHAVPAPAGPDELSRRRRRHRRRCCRRGCHTAHPPFPPSLPVSQVQICAIARCSPPPLLFVIFYFFLYDYHSSSLSRWTAGNVNTEWLMWFKKCASSHSCEQRRVTWGQRNLLV